MTTIDNTITSNTHMNLERNETNELSDKYEFIREP